MRNVLTQRVTVCVCVCVCVRYGLLVRQGESYGVSEARPREKGVKAVAMTLVSILAFLALICVTLLLLYFFYYPMGGSQIWPWLLLVIPLTHTHTHTHSVPGDWSLLCWSCCWALLSLLTICCSCPILQELQVCTNLPQYLSRDPGGCVCLSQVTGEQAACSGVQAGPSFPYHSAALPGHLPVVAS